MKCIKNKILAILCIIMVSIQFTNIPVFAAEGDSTADTGRQVINFNGDWKFFKGSSNDAPNVSFDDSTWDNITLPHTWNGGDGTSLGDGEDGVGTYYRGDGWYRKTITIGNEYENKKVYIKFLGANMEAEVYVNGQTIGVHRGGYEAFTFDITDALKSNSENLIAVKVNNKYTEEIAPLAADYTFFGGIYRDAYLVVTDEVHIGGTAVEDGADGLYLETSNVSKESANLNVKATINNDTNEDKNVTITATLKNPDKVNWISAIPQDKTPFNEADMAAGGNVLEPVTTTVTVSAGEGYEFSAPMTVNNPHLWNGRQDPYRYQVDLEVKIDGKVVDNLSDFVGFRYFSVDPEKGFFLNGESYPLRGVSRHQDRENLGWAISQNEHNEDFGLIYEMGVNSLRLAHYPHDPYFYELCDKYGIVVWAEIPLVSNIGGKGSYENLNEERLAFFETTKNQLVEMIKQNYNRPSICFWGLENEITDPEGVMPKFVSELNSLAKMTDKTGRLTTQALLSSESGEGWASDLVSANIYPGWYNGKAEDFGTEMDKKHAAESRPIGVSEYGSGANIEQHADNPTKIENASSFDTPHYEEYQSYCHEVYIDAINTRPYLWCTYVWNMFDFSVDGRSEGGQIGINDKGLVTRDRKIKKDSFYLYKANWNNDDKFAHITSKRYNPRERVSTNIKVYSNCDAVRLSINDKVIGTLKQSELAQKTVFNWDNIEFDLGDIEVKAEGLDADNNVISTDTANWTKNLSSTIQIGSKDEKVNIGSDTKQIELMRSVKASEINDIFYSDYASTFTLVDKDDTPITNNEVSIVTGMKLLVKSQDGKTTETYTFSEPSLAIGKTITASSYRNNPSLGNYSPENTIDQDFDTMWIADFGQRYPQWIKLDFGKEYNLNEIGISWFGSSAYEYTVSVSNDDSTYKKVADRSNNKESGKVNDAINERARYLKIDITGNENYDPENPPTSNLDGYPTITEIQVFGWELSSEKYIVNNDKNIIYVPKEHQLPPDKFFKELFQDNLTLEGNASIYVNAPAFYIADGDPVEITDASGIKTVYTVRFVQNSPDGDINGDGILEANDSSYILQYVLNPLGHPISNNAKQKADVDEDSIITANDAAFILKMVINSMNVI